MKLDNILIVNTFGIGDVLFSTPLLREIKRNLPRSRIHFICNRRNLDLLKNNPDIESILVFEKDDFRKAKSKSWIEFIRKMAHFVNQIRKLHADVAIDLTLNYQMNVFLIAAGIWQRVGFNYNDRGRFLTQKIALSGFNQKHVAEYYMNLSKFLGLDVSGKHRLWSFTSKTDKEAVDSYFKEKGLSGKTLVGIIAAGGKSWGMDAFYRRWDKDNFAYVGRKLSELSDDVRVIIFGTTEEKDICDDICSQIGKNAISLCGKTSLGLLVEYMSRCKLIICNEGGPMHIAVSQGVKTISIFGPVDDKIYGPYPESEMHKVIKADGLECRPCYSNFKYKICEEHHCLLKIDKDRVLKIARESLGI